MANYKLTPQQKEEANAILKQMRDAGKSDEEIIAYKKQYLADAKAANDAAKGQGPGSQTGASAGQSGGSASGTGTSDSPEQTWADYAQRAGKNPSSPDGRRYDDDGEVINLADDFGSVGEIVESIPFIGDLIDDLYGAVKQGRAQARVVDDALGLFAEGKDIDAADLEEYMARVAELNNQPVSTEMKDFNQAFEDAGGGAWGFISAIAQNPSIAATTMVSSLVAMANPSSLKGAAVGAGAGAGVGASFAGIGAIPGAVAGAMAGASGVLDTAMSFNEFLQEEMAHKGLEFNRENVQAILADKDALSRIRTRSAARGAVVGLVDGITGGIAAKSVKGIATAAKGLKYGGALAGATGLAIEGAGGGLGESLARVAAGQEQDAKEIGLEIVGEFGGGAAVVATAAREAKGRYQIGDEKGFTRSEMQAFLETASPEEAAAANISNDKELSSVLREKVVGKKTINQFRELIDETDLEPINDKIGKIQSLLVRKLRAPKDQQSAYTKTIDKLRGEVAEQYKEATSFVTGLNPDERNEYINNINLIKKKNEQLQLISDEEVKVDLQTEIDEISSANTALKQQGIVKAEAKRESARKSREAQKADEAVAAEEEAIEQESEELGVPPEQIKAQREEKQAHIDDDVKSNESIVEGLTQTLRSLGMNLVGETGSVPANFADTNVPLSQEGSSLSKGDFAKKIEIVAPNQENAVVDILNAIDELKKLKKQGKIDYNIERVQMGQGEMLTGTIFSPKREKSLDEQYPIQEAGTVEGEVVQQEVPQDLAVGEALGYAQSTEKNYGGRAYEGEAPIASEDGGIHYPGLTSKFSGDLKSAGVYPVLARYKRSGYPDAKFTQDDTGLTITPGEFKADAATDEFSIEGKKVRDKKTGKYVKAPSKAVLQQQDQARSISGVRKNKKKYDRKKKHKGRDEFSLDENRNYNDDQIDDLVFKNAEFVEDNNISQEDYAEVLGPEATEADVAEFSKRMNDQLGREQEGPSQEDIQYELDLLAAPGQTIDQAIEEGITDAQELYDNDDLVFEKANNLYPSNQETGAYNEEGHDNFLNEIQKIIDKKLGDEFSVGETGKTIDETWNSLSPKQKEDVGSRNLDYIKDFMDNRYVPIKDRVDGELYPVLTRREDYNVVIENLPDEKLNKLYVEHEAGPHGEANIDTTITSFDEGNAYWNSEDNVFEDLQGEDFIDHAYKDLDGRTILFNGKVLSEVDNATRDFDSDPKIYDMDNNPGSILRDMSEAMSTEGNVVELRDLLFETLEAIEGDEFSSSDDAYSRLPETLQQNIDDDINIALSTYPSGNAANQYFAHIAEGVFETNDESINYDDWYDDVREAVQDKYYEKLPIVQSIDNILDEYESEIDEQGLNREGILREIIESDNLSYFEAREFDFVDENTGEVRTIEKWPADYMDLSALTSSYSVDLDLMEQDAYTEAEERGFIGDEFSIGGQQSEIDRVKNLPLEAEDGATFNLDGSIYDSGGLVVPVASRNMKASELTNDAIEQFKEKYKDYMGPASKVGIYKFPGQDQVSIDLNIIAPSNKREEALTIGRSLGQESLFDLDTFENIKTGETGANPKTPTASQAKEISNRLGTQDEFSASDRKGGLDASDLADLGINEADLTVKAGEGQSYIKIPLDKQAGQSAGLAGGKGGFGSQGDAREAVGAIQSGQATQSAADFIKMMRDLVAVAPSTLTKQERDNALKTIRGIARRKHTIPSEKPSTIAGAGPGFKEGIKVPDPLGNIGYGLLNDLSNSITNSTPLSEERLQELYDGFDHLMGYKGAHLNLDRDYRIGIANDLNLKDTSRDHLIATKEGFKTRRRGTPEDAAAKEKLGGARADEITLTGGSRTVDLPLRTGGKRTPGTNIAQGTEVRKRRPRVARTEPVFSGKESAKAYSESTPEDQKGFLGFPESNTVEELSKEQPVLSREYNKIVREGKAAKVIEAWNKNQGNEKAQIKLIQQLTPFANYLARAVSRGGKDLTEVQGAAREALISAVTTGKYGEQTFNPKNTKRALGMLSGFIRDAVRNYYIGEGSPAGTTGRHSKYSAQLNEIRGAIRAIEKSKGKLAEGKIKVGQKGKTTSKRISFDNPQEIAEVINERRRKKFDAGKLKNLSLITPETVMKTLDREAQFEGDLGASFEGKDVFEDVIDDVPVADITDVLDNLRDKGGIEIAKLAGFDQEAINDLTDQIADLRDQALHSDKNVSDAKITNQITKLVGDKLNYKAISKNYKQIAKAISPNIEAARKMARFIKDEFIDNVKNEPVSTNNQRFKRTIGRFLGAQLEGYGLGKSGLDLGFDEFSLDTNNNPNHMRKNVADLHRMNYKKAADEVAFFIEDFGDQMSPKQFQEFTIGKNPDKFKAVKADIEDYYPGFEVSKHPNGSGEMMVHKSGVDPQDLILDKATRAGRVGDVDVRDFTSGKKGKGGLYSGFNINEFKNYIHKLKPRLNKNTFATVQRVNEDINLFDPKNLAEVKQAITDAGLRWNTTPDGLKVTSGKPRRKRVDEFSAEGVSDNRADVDDAINWLEKNNPETEFITSKEAIKPILERNGLPLSYWNQVFGVFTREGNIVLNPENVTTETPFHEVGHKYLKGLKKLAPKLYARMEGLAKKSKTYQKLKNHSIYKKYNEARFLEEVMAHDIGLAGAKIFAARKDATMWDKFRNKAYEFVAKKLGMSKKEFMNAKYNDLIEGAAADIATAGGKEFTLGKPDEFNVAEDTSSDPDVSAAHIKGQQAEGKWYTKPLKWLIPPAADDYHGLVSKLNIPGIKKVTDTFIKNHHDHIEKVTEARKAIDKARKELGIDLGKKDVAEIDGAKLTAAQAIQAHVNGKPTDFTNQPKVQKYIKAMQDMGVLTEKKTYHDASPDADTYQFLNDKMYQDNFEGFRRAKEEVFTPKVKAAILAEHGPKFVKALDLALQRMSSGKNSGSSTDATTQKWNDWALGSVGTIMFLNFRSAALQMMSVMNYGLESKSPGSFVSSFFSPDTWAEAKKLYSSGYLTERRKRAGYDVNLNEMMGYINSSKNFGDFTKRVLNKGFIATSAVDSMAIAMGGAAFIKAQQKAGVSRSEAIKQWKEKTEEAQQSARPDRVSQWQTEGISKFILAFANTPQQYFRLSQKAFRTIKDKNATTAQKRNAMAKIGYYMVVQNAMFSMAQAASLALLGMDPEDEDGQKAKDALSSMSSTILRGMGLYGAVIESGKNVIMQAIKEEGKANPDHVNSVLKATSISPPLNRKIQDLLSIGRAHKYDADDKYATTAARGISVTTNLPADWAQKKYNAAKNLWDDQFTAWQKLLMLAGWSEWNFKDSKSKKDEGFSFDDSAFSFNDEGFEFGDDEGFDFE